MAFPSFSGSAAVSSPSFSDPAFFMFPRFPVSRFQSPPRLCVIIFILIANHITNYNGFSQTLMLCFVMMQDVHKHMLLEVSRLKWKHAQEIAEVQHNAG